MAKNHVLQTPKTGINGLKENWRNDLIAGFSVSLVALPLGLGISIASGAPPLAGVISAIVAGLITTFIRSSHIAINGPANALIVVILSTIAALGDYKYALAVFVCAGILQIILGVLKMGRIADALPSSVIQGMLAAIGIMILSKQAHVALGVKNGSSSYFDVITSIPSSFINMNPFVAIISLIALVIMIFHPKVKSKFVHFIPAPVWVIASVIPFVYLFNFFDDHTIDFMSKAHEVGPKLLINLPERVIDSLVFPDFSMIGKVDFWLAVISVTLVGSVECLVSAKAVEKLDPYKRRVNMNKDLISVGISTIASAMIGGLPIIVVIVRSSVNVNNHAKTKWSNFFHGAILLVFIFAFSSIMQKIPLAALAAILVFTGFKLASPKVFKDSKSRGPEQLIIMLSTLLITLWQGLIVGIFSGVILNLLVHLIRFSVSYSNFFNYLLKPEIVLVNENNQDYYVKIFGICNFANIIKLINKIDEIPEGKHVVVDCTNAKLIDFTVLEYLHNQQIIYNSRNGHFEMLGLGYHKTSSNHLNALHILEIGKDDDKSRLSKREKDMKALCETEKWDFNKTMNWEPSVLNNFEFFKSRPVEYKKDTISGGYKNTNTKWQVFDVTFDEGAFIAKEVFHTTLQYITLPFEIPEFTLEKEGFFDRIIEFAIHEEIDFPDSKNFSHKFLLKGEEKEKIKQLFDPELRKFFEEEEIYHIESDGEALIVFKQLRLSSNQEISKLINFSERLVEHLASIEKDLAKI